MITGAAVSGDPLTGLYLADPSPGREGFKPEGDILYPAMLSSEGLRCWFLSMERGTKFQVVIIENIVNNERVCATTS